MGLFIDSNLVIFFFGKTNTILKPGCFPNYPQRKGWPVFQCRFPAETLVSEGPHSYFSVY